MLYHTYLKKISYLCARKTKIYRIFNLKKQSKTMKTTKHLLTLLCALMWATMVSAGNYMDYLTAARGFTEVTTTDDIVATPDYYYLLAPAETTDLLVGVGTYEAKPDWANDKTKALRYFTVDSDPVLNLSNFFTIEQQDQFIGFRNVFYNASLFQTHDNAGFMYVLTYTEPTMSQWTRLTPTYQNGYWLFESGMYPMSSNNWACGYLGPWNNRVTANEAIALNRRNTPGDEAGHYRLFRIRRTDMMVAWAQQWQAASNSNPIDVSWMITNPSFETGDARGWTLAIDNGDNEKEFGTRDDVPMSDMDGQWLLNAWGWWIESVSISQTVDNIPNGRYQLSGVLCTWEGRSVSFSANGSSLNQSGEGDQTGLPVSMGVTIGQNQRLTINVESKGQWWVSGHEGESTTFFKFDNAQLKCTGLPLNGVAAPLPNDDTTTLVPNLWYYYDVTFPTEYWLSGNLSGMEMSTDGDKYLTNVTTETVEREMTLNGGRIFFRTSRTDATLHIQPRHTPEGDTFTAVALNVDGLPNKILFTTLNEDGPGEEGTKKISQYLAGKGYDIIGCSEDFNYNGALMESLNNSYSCGTIRKTLSANGLSLDMLINGFRFDTDGLNLIWKNSTTTAENESWTQWSSMKDTDGNQYVRKGYRHYDMTVGNNEPFDVYILHMDAGDTNATDSRHSQWEQLAGAINSADPNRPKLVIGDTNSRWTRENIKEHFVDKLNNGLSMSDVWVEFYRNGVYPSTDMDDLTDNALPENYANYEIVDKIIYINPTTPNAPQLLPMSFRIEQDYTYGTIDHDGNTKPLGDHKPVVVEFKYVKPDSNEPVSFAVAGDINYDNQVSVADITALVNIFLGFDNGETKQYDHEAADVNGDGEVNDDDISALLSLMFGNKE